MSETLRHYLKIVSSLLEIIFLSFALFPSWLLLLNFLELCETRLNFFSFDFFWLLAFLALWERWWILFVVETFLRFYKFLVTWIILTTLRAIASCPTPNNLFCYIIFLVSLWKKSLVEAILPNLPKLVFQGFALFKGIFLTDWDL